MIAPNQTFTGKVGVPFSQTPAHTGTISSWSLQSGSLPAGLSLNPTTGLISGTPTAKGTNNAVLSYPGRISKVFSAAKNNGDKSALLANGKAIVRGYDIVGNFPDFGLENKTYDGPYIDIALETYWGLFLKTDGTIDVLGRYSQVGPGAAVPFIPAALNNNIVGVAAVNGNSAIALKSNGTVISWKTDLRRSEVHAVVENSELTSTLSGISRVRAAGGRLAVVTNTGTVLARGLGSAVHGNPNPGSAAWIPVWFNGAPLSGVLDVLVVEYQRGIAATVAALLVLKTDGTVLVLKESFTAGAGVELPPANLSSVTAIAAATAYTDPPGSGNTTPVFLAQKSNGSLVVWGGGNVGNPTPSAYLPPAGLSLQPATSQNDRKTISGGTQYFLALKTDGTVVGWGPQQNDHYSAGNSASPPALSASISFSIEADASLTFNQLKAKSVFVGSQPATAVYHGSQRLL